MTIPVMKTDNQMSAWGYLVFSMGSDFHVPDEELDLSRELATPAVTAISLTNDLVSYQKDCDEAKKAGSDNVKNALWVIMNERNVSLNEARSLCRSRIEEEVEKYLKMVESTQKNMKLSMDVREYLRLLQYAISGNVAWSAQCPRYHEGIKYNELQALRAKHGVEKYPTLWRSEHRAQPSANNGRTDSKASSLPILNQEKQREMDFEAKDANGSYPPSNKAALNRRDEPRVESNGKISQTEATISLAVSQTLPKLTDDVSRVTGLITFEKT